MGAKVFPAGGPSLSYLPCWGQKSWVGLGGGYGHRLYRTQYGVPQVWPHCCLGLNNSLLWGDCRMVSSVLSLYPLDAGSQPPPDVSIKLSPNIVTCPTIESHTGSRKS